MKAVILEETKKSHYELLAEDIAPLVVSVEHGLGRIVVLAREVDAQQVRHSTAYVLPALEIIDSRIADWDLTIADTVATPIEQEVNGVQDMLYMSSQSTSDGTMTLTVTFKLGTNLDIAQVLVQNRVATAEPRLPDQVRALGVTTKKKSPSMMMVVNLISPDNTYDQTYISNYAFLQIRDVLNRIEGVGDVLVLGAREYSMRVWLDPDKMWSRQLTTDDVVKAIQAQNMQVAAGRLGSEPAPTGTNVYPRLSRSQVDVLHSRLLRLESCRGAPTCQAGAGDGP